MTFDAWIRHLGQMMKSHFGLDVKFGPKTEVFLTKKEEEWHHNAL